MKYPKTDTIDIEDIGMVLFKSSKKTKGLSIKLKPFKGVEVIYPSRFSRKKTLEIVRAKKDWIIKSMEKIKKRENQLTVFDENTDFSTKYFKLQIQKHSDESMSVELKNNILSVYYPENVPVSDSSVQEIIRIGIENALRIEAKKILPKRVSQLADKYRFVYNKIYIKKLKSRWGSCSSENNINLNIHLMRMTDSLIDYVILHELCHTKEKNHGANFWALLNKYTDNKAKSLSKELKKFGTTIY